MTDLQVLIKNTLMSEIISLELNYNIKSCFNSFTLILPYSAYDAKNIYKPFTYPEIKIKVDNKVIFIGMVEIVSTNLKTLKVVLQGRNKTSVLTVSSFLDKYSYEKVSLLQVTNLICGDYKINVKAPNGDTKKFESLEFSIEKDVYTNLKEIANLSNIKGFHPLIYTDFEGNLVVGGNVNNNKVVMNYDAFDSTFIDMKVSFDGTLRHNAYHVYGQSADSENIEGLLNDKEISINNKFVILGNGSNIEECTNIALANKSMDTSLSCEINIATKNWFDKNNNILEIGKNVTLKSENCFIFAEETFMIEAIDFIFNDDGYTTKMKLTPKDTYKL